MKLSNNQVRTLEQAAKILEKIAKYEAVAFTCSKKTKEYFHHRLVGKENEVFSVAFLDSQHRLIEVKDLFHGTVDAASVYPRVVVKEAMEVNAAAIIVSHNHPSGIAEPSKADVKITERLRDALSLMDIRLLDHIVVGQQTVSMSERGLF